MDGLWLICIVGSAGISILSILLTYQSLVWAVNSPRDFLERFKVAIKWKRK